MNVVKRAEGPPSRMGVVVNPHAGGRAFDGPRVAALRARLSTGDRVAVSESPQAVESIARDFVEGGIDIVGVVGGDASASTVLTGLWKVYGARLPAVALLGAGTMNTIAASLGVPRQSPERLIGRILEARRHNARIASVRRGTLRVQDRLGFLFGLGAVPGFLSEYYAAGRGCPDAWTAAWVLARLATSAVLNGSRFRHVVDPFEASLQIDDRRMPRQRYFLVAAGTVADVGLGFRPFHHADACVGRFEVLAAHGSPRRLLASFPRMQRGRPPARDVARTQLCRSLRVAHETGSIPYSLDGDLFEGPSALHVDAGPVFDFLLP